MKDEIIRENDNDNKRYVFKYTILGREFVEYLSFEAGCNEVTSMYYSISKKIRDSRLTEILK